MIILRASHSPFLQKRFRANTGALTQKRGFACASNNFTLRAKSLKRDESFCLISEKTQHSPLPAALCSVFSLRRYVTALLFLNRRIHSFRVCPSAYWGKSQKCDFDFFKLIIKNVVLLSGVTAARGKPLGFPLKLSAFRSRQLGEKCENLFVNSFRRRAEHLGDALVGADLFDQ